MDIFDEFNESSFSNNPFDTTNNSDEYKTSSNNQVSNFRFFFVKFDR